MKLKLHIIVAIGCLVSPVASIAQSPVLRAAFTNPAPVVIGGQNVIINPVSSPQQFFRLIQ